jgi:hypothetical protein
MGMTVVERMQRYRTKKRSKEARAMLTRSADYLTTEARRLLLRVAEGEKVPDLRCVTEIKSAIKYCKRLEAERAAR